MRTDIFIFHNNNFFNTPFWISYIGPSINFLFLLQQIATNLRILNDRITASLSADWNRGVDQSVMFLQALGENVFFHLFWLLPTTCIFFLLALHQFHLCFNGHPRLCPPPHLLPHPPSLPRAPCVTEHSDILKLLRHDWKDDFLSTEHFTDSKYLHFSVFCNLGKFNISEIIKTFLFA